MNLYLNINKLNAFTAQKNLIEKSTCGRVWVTVHSPAIRQSISGQLLDAIELNWDFGGCSVTPGKVLS